MIHKMNIRGDAVMAYIITTALACLAWAIWVRRATLQPADEHQKLTQRSITVALILQFCGLLLMGSRSSATLGKTLHHFTGQHNLDTWIGHSLYIGAGAMIGVHIASRLNISEDQLRAAFTKYVARPMTLIIPVTLALLVKSPNADQYWPDFFDCPLDGWLKAYWVITCGFIGYLLAAMCWPLILLRRDPRNRRTATLYLIACVLGVLVCAARIATIGQHVDLSNWFWTGDSLIGIAFAYSSSQSWWHRNRQKVYQ